MNTNDLKSTRLPSYATKSNVEMSGAHDWHANSRSDMRTQVPGLHTLEEYD